MTALSRRLRWSPSAVLAAGLVAIMTWATAPTGVLAQDDVLERADRLVREGRTNEARGTLLGWWEERYDQAGRDLQQRALWLRARLTVEPAQAVREYQRLVVLYPGGPFTDQALFRLVQAAHALGDEPQARAHLNALIRDYPGSPMRRTAEAWLAEAGEATAPAETPVAPAETRAPAVGAFSVQLGAFGEEPRARAVFTEAMAAGFDARLVRVEGSPLLHVRVGSFAERDGAQALFDRLAREGLQGAVVRDERAERPVSD